METKANYVLIGAFTVAGFLGILGFLTWFSQLQLNRQFAYYDVFFPEVAGLSVSSDVLFAGLGVGQVVDMELAPDRVAAVRVRIEVAEDTPIRTDSAAAIESSAVTGVSTVSIAPGSNDAPLLRDASEDPVPVIPASRSTLQTLGQQAPELLGQLNVLAGQLTQIMGDENQAKVAQILQNVERSTANLDKTMADVSRATDAVAAVADSMAGFGDRLDGLGATADTALARFSDAAAQADRTLAGIDGYVADQLTPLTRDVRGSVTAVQTDLSGLAQRSGDTLERLDTTLETATGALETARRTIDGLDPVFADLRRTLGRLDEALANLPQDLPQIVARLREAAGSAAEAFESLRVILDSSRAPVQAFSTQALPQFSRLASDLRGLVDNANQLLNVLKRNPAQILRDQPTPEFRR